MGGFLAGIMKEAGNWAEKQNLLQLQQKIDAQRNMASFLEKLAEHPDAHPQARDQFIQMATEARMAEPGKYKPPKPEDIVKVWTPPKIEEPKAQEQGPEATPAIGTPMGEGRPLAIPPMPFVQPRQARSAFYSPEEQLQQKTQAAQVMSDIQQKRQMAEEEQRSKHAIELAKTRSSPTTITQLAKARMRPVYDTTTGVMTGVEDIPEDELPVADRVKLELQRAQADYAEAGVELRHAQAAGDPAKTALAQKRVDIAAGNLEERRKQNLALNQGVDASGAPLPGAPRLPSGEAIGSRFSRFWGPTAQILSRSQAAPAVIRMAQNLQEFAKDPTNADLFGPASGRLTELERKFGTDDPRIAKLRSRQVGLASLLVPLHGFRSQNAAESFVDTIRVTYGPDAFADALQGHIETALLLEEAANTARGTKAPSPMKVPTPPGKVEKPKSWYDTYTPKR